MLERKFTSFIECFLQEEPNKILLVNGARQIGKSYLIRYVTYSGANPFSFPGLQSAV